MTENIRKEMLEDIRDGCMDVWDSTSIDELFETIEKEHNEIQQYKAICTLEEFQAYKQGNCTNNCKHYDSTAEYVRNKTIDEFVKQMSQEFLRNDEDGNLYIFAWIDDFKKIAEQMKAGSSICK